MCSMVYSNYCFALIFFLFILFFLYFPSFFSLRFRWLFFYLVLAFCRHCDESYLILWVKLSFIFFARKESMQDQQHFKKWKYSYEEKKFSQEWKEGKNKNYTRRNWCRNEIREYEQKWQSIWNVTIEFKKKLSR